MNDSFVIRISSFVIWSSFFRIRISSFVIQTMHYQALACDYDGTLAHDGIVDRDVAGALDRCRDAGRRLLLVTGRELRELQAIFERLDLFDYVVAENGALLYRPATGEERLLAGAPPDAFIQALRTRGVDPLALGHAIVATRSPFETV